MQSDSRIEANNPQKPRSEPAGVEVYPFTFG